MEEEEDGVERESSDVRAEQERGVARSEGLGCFLWRISE